ncbi:MAG TPA: hypothetical protein VGK58_19800 [Lacipirellulaceae bacterium]
MQFLLLIRRNPWTPGALLRTIMLVGFCLAPSAPAICSPTALEGTSAPIPEPVYWKQNVFLIPYQFSSAAEPGAAQAVWLFVSKDRGATWQKISDAKPHVKSFNYRAEGDGEYWFAIRTLDHHGRAWPAGPYQPELRVIVDTTMPRIEALHTRIRRDGAIDIHWHGSDTNLDAATWRIEAQLDTNSPWQPVPTEGASSEGQGVGASNTYPAPPGSNFSSLVSYSSGEAIWQPPSGKRPVAIRASVSDRAGNTATYCAPVETAPLNEQAVQRLPVVGGSIEAIASSGSAGVPAPISEGAFNVADVAPAASAATGWVSSSNVPPGAAAVSAPPAEQPRPPAEQPWPPTFIAHAPFQLSTSGQSPVDDAVTAYGNPAGIGPPWAMQAEPRSNYGDAGVPARFATAAESNTGITGDTPVPSPDSAPFQPLQPYREASTTPLRDNSAAAASPLDVRPKFVGSRTFALEYDVEYVGRGGISKVELWATRDGGQTWFRLAQDDDNRTPLMVTVDEQGVYGFRLVVDSALAPSAPPSPGDAPELCVAVDLQRPIAELTAIEQGAGNMNDHLILRWRADDNNLEPRPISLFYSSRPAGPWSAVATSLENTGQYAWRVERHVPGRFYLRLEARDTAGNLAAFQTRDAVEFAPPAASGRLRSAEPLDPTAVGDGAAYR